MALIGPYRELNERGAAPRRMFPVDPERVLKFWNDGLTLEQISRKFVGISVHDVRPALECALNGPVPKRNPAPIPPDIPRCAPSPLCVQEVETLANKIPKFGNSLHDLRRACDRLIVLQFTEFLAAGYGPWNGESNVPWLTLERVRNSLRRSGRPDLWEKIDPYQCRPTFRVAHSRHRTSRPSMTAATAM